MNVKSVHNLTSKISTQLDEHGITHELRKCSLDLLKDELTIAYRVSGNDIHDAELSVVYPEATPDIVCSYPVSRKADTLDNVYNIWKDIVNSTKGILDSGNICDKLEQKMLESGIKGRVVRCSYEDSTNKTDIECAIYSFHDEMCKCDCTHNNVNCRLTYVGDERQSSQVSYTQDTHSWFEVKMNIFMSQWEDMTLNLLRCKSCQ